MSKTSRTNKPARRTSTSKANPANKNTTGLSPSKRHREKLNSVMDELCELLPLSNEVKASLDRLSVLKLTVSFFHTQNLMITDTNRSCKQQRNGDEKAVVTTIDGGSLSELALQAIGGFFLVLTEDGIVYYISENVKTYLGYPQTRLMHQEFFPIVDPDDLHGLNACFHAPIKNSFERSNSSFTGGRQECFCNLKCHAGRLSSHISPFYYKCFKFYGHIKTVTNRCTGESKVGFFALCTPVTRQIDVCRPLNNNVEKYTCKMNAAMSNLEVDSRGLKFLALSEKELQGKNSYFFFHPEDLPGMALAHECLLLGRKVCISFRVLKGNKKWQWVRGRAYSIIVNGKVEGMVSKNFFLSEEEGKYFKEQDMKDILEWKAQKALVYPSSQTCDSPSSGTISPCNETFHPVQVAPFPQCELLSQDSPVATASGVTNDVPQACSLTLLSKREQERSSCLVNDNPPPFKDIPDIDTDTMLRVIKDLQDSLIESSANTPSQYHNTSDMDMKSFIASSTKAPGSHYHSTAEVDMNSLIASSTKAPSQYHNTTDVDMNSLLNGSTKAQGTRYHSTPDIDMDSLIASNTKTPSQYHNAPEVDMNSLIHNGTKAPGSHYHSSPDIDMVNGAVMDDMEQQLLENSVPLLDIPLHSSLHVNKHYVGDVYSEPTDMHEIGQGFQQQVPESFFRCNENRFNSFPVVGPQSSVDIQQASERPHLVRSSGIDNIRLPGDNKGLIHMDENSLADFVPLPLVEVENILSNDEPTYSMTSNSASSTFAQPMDMSPRYQYSNYIHGNQSQFYGGSFVDGSAVSCHGSRSDNEFVAASQDYSTELSGHVALDERHAQVENHVGVYLHDVNIDQKRRTKQMI